MQGFTLYTTPGYIVGPPHRVLFDALDQVMEGKITRLMVFMPPQNGKALHINTLIPTIEGWKKICELKKGDYVFDENGKPIQVIATSEIFKNRKLYKVEDNEGNEILADENHEWMVRLDRKRPVWKKYETKRLFCRTSPRHALIQKSKSLKLKNKELPIDPYVLGLWLGDGHSACGTITQGNQDIKFIRREIEEKGFKTSDHKADTAFGVLGLCRLLRVNGLINNKHIPKIYMRASEEQRMELLRGLIDTDGYVSPKGQIEFCSVKELLAMQVAELVKTLGVKCTVSIGNATIGGRFISKKYRLLFYLKDAAALPRKKELTRNGVKNPGQYLRVSEGGIGDTVCIQVDSDSHLFLCGPGFWPTCNSTIISKRFPAFVLGKKPDKFVISASYEQELATEFGGEVRNVVASQIYQNIFPGVDLREDSKAAGRWNTLQGGGYFAAGIGSGLAGRGGDLGIIDDPVKDRKAAESKVVREATKRWYQNVFYTRLHHPCPIIIVMTRYHEDDLCGWLLKESGEEWKVLNLQGICETMPDPCGRQPGEALWPEKYPIETLKKIKKAIGEREFNSLYQGKPASLEGNILKRSQFRRYNERTCPELFDDIQGYIDANVSEGIDNDYFAIALWGMKGPKFYLLDLAFDILSMDGQLELSKAFIAKHPECRRWHFENKANGPAIVNLLSKEISGLLPVEPASPLGNAKVQRAIAVQPFLASGDILIPETTPENMEWIDIYLTQCAQFPFGDHDDLVDVTTGPINWWKMNPLYGIGFGGDGDDQEEEDEQQV